MGPQNGGECATLLDSAVWNITVQYSVQYYRTVQCVILSDSKVWNITGQCSVQYYRTVQCAVLLDSAVCNITVQHSGTICGNAEGVSWWMEPLGQFLRVLNGVPRESIEGPQRGSRATPRNFRSAKPKGNTEEQPSGPERDLQYSPEGRHAKFHFLYTIQILGPNILP